MESQDLYDQQLQSEFKKASEMQAEQVNNMNQKHELLDLNNPEMTLDLHSTIESLTSFGDHGFNILNTDVVKHLTNSRIVEQNFNMRSLSYLPQPVHSAASYRQTSNSLSDSNSRCNTPIIKEENIEAIEFRRQCQVSLQQNLQSYPASPGPYVTSPPIPNFSNLPQLHQHQVQQPLQLHQQQHQQQQPQQQQQHQHQHQQQHARKQSKKIDKASEEYKKRRERNNIAVRKSREKAKIRSQLTERQVKDLQRENENLIKKIQLLSEELHVLKTMANQHEQLQRGIIARRLDQNHSG